MVNPEFVAAIQPIASNFGMSGEFFLALISIVVSIMIGIFCTGITKKPPIGMAGFMITMAIAVVFQTIDWFVVIIPLILVGVFYIKQEGGA